MTISKQIYSVFTIFQLLLFLEQNYDLILKARSGNLPLIFYILVIIFFLQDPIIIFLLLDLMILHIFLKFKNMTTYEYIITQRSAKEKNQINKNLGSKNRPKPIIKIESQVQINNQFLNPNCTF